MDTACRYTAQGWPLLKDIFQLVKSRPSVEPYEKLSFTAAV